MSRQGRTLYAQKIGDVVTSRLLHSFKDLMDYGFTAQMEEDLDRIAAGDKVVPTPSPCSLRTQSTRALEDAPTLTPVVIAGRCPCPSSDCRWCSCECSCRCRCSGRSCLPLPLPRSTVTLSLVHGWC